MTKKPEILRLDEVSVSFDGFKALNSLSFSVNKNEMKAIIGPNGAGKTTMQDVITGKTKTDKGNIYFKNNNLNNFSESEIANLGIGRKFQKPSVFNNITVWDNLSLAMNVNKNFFKTLFFNLNEKYYQLANQVIDTINLSEKRDELAGTLSHGEKQWLEIGMLLMQDSDLMLIDEPAAGMTEEESKKTSNLLQDISKNRSILVVEHDMDFIDSLGVGVIVLHEGSILASGDMNSIKKNKKVIEVYLGR